MAHHVGWGLSGTVALVGLAAAGCAGAPPAAAMRSTPAELEAAIEADVASLRSLEAFDVGSLVMRLPAEATACYGLPCNDADRTLWDAERRTQAERLADLVSRALPAAEHAATTAPSTDEVVAALASLRALEIVTVGELIEVQPANNPECYNLPCETDRALAEATNAHHAAVVVAVAAAVR